MGESAMVARGLEGVAMRAKHVAVLMGGWSAEREVSISSGKACAAALETRGYRVTRIDVGRDIATVLATLKPDVALNVLHGRPGEDGTLQGVLEVLVIPYTLVNNDARYLLPGGFACGDDFYRMLRDAFDQLWHEGARAPKMMSVGLHPRISGHPARAMALARFLDDVRGRDAVWICRREDIARHWMAEHPA